MSYQLIRPGYRSTRAPFAGLGACLPCSMLGDAGDGLGVPPIGMSRFMKAGFVQPHHPTAYRAMLGAVSPEGQNRVAAIVGEQQARWRAFTASVSTKIAALSPADAERVNTLRLIWNSNVDAVMIRIRRSDMSDAEAVTVANGLSAIRADLERGVSRILDEAGPKPGDEGGGEDEPILPWWGWLLIGVGGVALLGGGAAVFRRGRRRPMYRYRPNRRRRR